MKLGFLLGYSGKHIHMPIELIQQAESMGYDSVWTAEAYGNDAVTSAAYVLAQTSKIRVGTAIMQMPARTPAMCAMTAMSLDQLSGGRFIVGLGCFRPAGGRRLARCALRQACDPHQGVHPDHAQDLRARRVR
jgi:alkanesulfonate monooxygenase SsuD/methylene tetrahydromethanopterin reductase-like flavin-dependent oxidoreductase (luciferase family)